MHYFQTRRRRWQIAVEFIYMIECCTLAGVLYASIYFFYRYFTFTGCIPCNNQLFVLLFDSRNRDYLVE